MKGPGKIHLDGTRAVRVAAGVGLAVIGISLLPGLLRPPTPEPLPPDVGFRPGENPVSALPLTAPPIADTEAARVGSRKPRTDGHGSPKKPRAGDDGTRRTRRNGNPGEGAGTDRGAVAESPDGDDPLPLPAPPPVTPWVPPAPSSPPVGDGSAEFAPR